jgi:hypothetical protein
MGCFFAYQSLSIQFQQVAKKAKAMAGTSVKTATTAQEPGKTVGRDNKSSDKELQERHTG